MTLPVPAFAALPAGTQPLSLFDQQFGAIAQSGNIFCNATGSNTLALAPVGNQFVPIAYTDGAPVYLWVQPGTNTGAVTISVASLSAGLAYKQNGQTALVAGDLVAGSLYAASSLSSLGGGAGGFVVNPAAAGGGGGGGSGLLVVFAPEMFGAAGDGIADDTAALVAMRDAIRASQAANPAVTYVMSLGAGKTYMYTNNRWTWGISRLRVLGNGATLKPTGNTAIYGYYPFVSGRGMLQTTPIDQPFAGSSTIGKLINTTNAGATQVTLVTSADASNFSVGQWCIVYSYNQLTTGGYAPSARYFDWCKITAIVGGVLTLDRALGHRHSSMFPEPFITGTDPQFQNHGRARIAPFGNDVPIAEYFYMENITFLDNPNVPSGTVPQMKSHNYLLISGAVHAELYNVTATQLVPSMVMQMDTIGGTFWACEADKMCHMLNFYGTVFNGTTQTVGLTEATGCDIINYIGGACHEVHIGPREMNFKGVTFNNADVTNYLTFSDSGSGYPIKHVSISECTFVGAGTTVPIQLNAAAITRITVGSGGVTVSGATITISDITVSPAGVFLRCSEPGGYVGLLKGGTGTEFPGTITDLIGIGGTSGATMPVVIPGQTVVTGDILVCRENMRAQIFLSAPNAPTSITPDSNSYSGYTAANVLPSV